MENFFRNEGFASDFFVRTTDTDNQNVPVMVFADLQPVGELFSTEEALCRGTLFKNLDKPFIGRNTRC